MYLCTLKIIGMTGQKTPTALGTEKIGKLLMQYAIPAIIAMTASSLYNMVDSIFIVHGVGPMAISGLALTFPLMNLAAAFGSLVGVGAATLVSVKLGQKDYDTELDGLKTELPGKWEYYIDRLSCHIASSGRKYKSHAATIFKWAQEDAAKKAPKKGIPDYTCKEGESL